MTRRPTYLILAALLPLVSTLAVPTAPGGAAAAGDPNCSTIGPTTTCTYTVAGEYALSIPAGLRLLHMQAVGAPGGGDVYTGAGGGVGATTTADVPVPTGATTLYAEVGGAGTAADGESTNQPGGYNGGGAGSRLGGSGGGASDVRTCAETASSCSACPGSTACVSSTSQLVVAGGGGGGGGVVGGAAAGGAAGAGNSATGGNGADCSSGDGSGGKGATAGSGGAGGAGSGGGGSGTGGVSGQGGDAVVNGRGGGGGGGYFGGGGGGDDNNAPCGGGGGAGSSFIAPGGIGTIATASSGATPEVIVSYSLFTVDASTGTNASGCGAPSSPCQTITDALTQGQPASTLLITPGTYCEQIVVSQSSALVASGTHGSAIIDGGAGESNGCAKVAGDTPGNPVVSVGVGAPSIVVMQGLTVQNGDGSTTRSGGFLAGEGGGISVYPNARLTLLNDSVTNNTACSLSTCLNPLGPSPFAAAGGGIFNDGTLTVSASSISGNVAAAPCANATSSCDGYGGGIYNEATATITDSTISANSANSACPATSSSATCSGFGGGLYNAIGATLTASGSAVSGNAANSGCGGNDGIECRGHGGGVGNNGTATIFSSTVSGNVAGLSCGSACQSFGGGLANGGGPFSESGSPGALLLMNSTVADNTACTLAASATTCDGYGGGMSNLSTAEAISSTISDNSACSVSACGDSGGIYSQGGQMSLDSTILAGNHAPSGSADCSGGFQDVAPAGGTGGYNLIGVNTNCIVPGMSATDKLGSTSSPLNAGLGPLQNNGGMGPGGPQTMAPQIGSPAVNNGDVATCVAGAVSAVPIGTVPGPNNVDERGYARHADTRAACDIGAVDAGGSPAPPTALTAQVGDGQATITWHGPTTAGGNPPYGYSLTWTCMAQCPSSSGAVSLRSRTLATTTEPSQSFTSTVSGLTDGATYTFSVTTNNPDGVSSSATVNATPAVSPRVSIAKGWNLIDVPTSDPSTSSASGVVGSIDGQLGGTTPAVSALATFTHGRFTLYVPGYSTDQGLAPDQGIFLLSTAGGAWNPPGSVYTSARQVTLGPGWNLVAAPYPNGALTGGALDLQLGSGCGFQEAAILGPSGYSTYLAGSGVNETIPSTSGVWVECTQSYTWTPTT